jgi:predicted nuclease with TOPRIM domain
MSAATVPELQAKLAAAQDTIRKLRDEKAARLGGMYRDALDRAERLREKHAGLKELVTLLQAKLFEWNRAFTDAKIELGITEFEIRVDGDHGGIYPSQLREFTQIIKDRQDA